MRREVVGLIAFVGCTTPSPVPNLGEAPAVDDVSVVPAVESPDEALRDTSAVDTPATPRASASSRSEPIDPAIGSSTLTERDAPFSTAGCSGWPSINGLKFDATGQCYRPLSVGCGRRAAVVLPMPDARCVMRDDGAVYVGPSSTVVQLGGGWGACSPEEQAMADGEVKRPMCTGASTDGQPAKSVLQ